MTESCPRCGDEVFVAWQRGHEILLNAAGSDDGPVSVVRDPDPHEPNPLLVVEGGAYGRGPRYQPHVCGKVGTGAPRRL